MKHAIMRVASIGCAITLLSVAALAQAATDTTVTVPWGDTLAQVLTAAQETLTVLLLGVVAAAVAKLPGWAQIIINTWRVEQLLAKAITYGINTTVGAVKGEQLQVEVGNVVVKKALDYAIASAPGWLIAWMGGEAMVKQKIMARVDVGPGALRE